MMYNSPASWDTLMQKLVEVTAAYSADQVDAGADAIQIFDSWVGCLSVEDYRRYVFPHVSRIVKQLQKTGVPIIYFGTDSATLLPSMKETGADVIGLDWRIPLDEGWARIDHRGAVQGNLDPVMLFADWKELKSRAEGILRQAEGRAGHIFNLGLASRLLVAVFPACLLPMLLKSSAARGRISNMCYMRCRRSLEVCSAPSISTGAWWKPVPIRL
jgi:uroporphyrinogen decarboxylase